MTSNRVFSEREEIFQSATATAAAIDRIVHHSSEGGRLFIEATESVWVAESDYDTSFQGAQVARVSGQLALGTSGGFPAV